MRWGQGVGAVESVADAIEYMLSDGRQGCGADLMGRRTVCVFLPNFCRRDRVHAFGGEAVGKVVVRI